MRGNYSPTVNVAYSKDQSWWRKYAYPAGDTSDEFVMYDPEGFDSYGYNKDDVDRAGNQEHVYYSDDTHSEIWGSYNFAYDDALAAWGFDGVKPVRKE